MKLFNYSVTRALAFLLAITFFCLSSHAKIDRANIDTIERAVSYSEIWFKSNLNPKWLFNDYYNPISDNVLNPHSYRGQLMASNLLASMSKDRVALKAIHLRNLAAILSMVATKYGAGWKLNTINTSEELEIHGRVLQTLISSPANDAHKEDIDQLFLKLRNFLLERNLEGTQNLFGFGGEKTNFIPLESALIPIITYSKGREIEMKIDQIITRLEPKFSEGVKANLNRTDYKNPFGLLSSCKLIKIDPNLSSRKAFFDSLNGIKKIIDNDQFPGRFYNPRTRFGSISTLKNAYLTRVILCAEDLIERLGLRENVESLKFSAVNNLLSLQYRKHNSLFGNSKKSVVGAFKTNYKNSDVRLESNTMAIQALRESLKSFNKR